MLPARYASRKSFPTSSTYVCLSCRLKSTQRTPRTAGNIDEDLVLGLRSLEQDEENQNNSIRRRLLDGDKRAVRPKRRRRYGRSFAPKHFEREQAEVDSRSSKIGPTSLLANESLTSPAAPAQGVAKHGDESLDRHIIPKRVQLPSLKFRKYHHSDQRQIPQNRTFYLTKQFDSTYIPSYRGLRILREPPKGGSVRKFASGPLVNTHLREEEIDYFEPPPSRDEPRLRPRRQFGTPIQVKQEEALDEKRRESLLDVLDAHRGSVEGGKVDWDGVENAMREGRKTLNRKDVFRPHEVYNGVREQLLKDFDATKEERGAARTAFDHVEDFASALAGARRDERPDDPSEESQYKPFGPVSETAVTAEVESDMDTDKNPMSHVPLNPSAHAYRPSHIDAKGVITEQISSAHQSSLASSEATSRGRDATPRSVSNVEASEKTMMRTDTAVVTKANEQAPKTSRTATYLAQSSPEIFSPSSTSAWQRKRSSDMPYPSSSIRTQLRLLHTTRKTKQQAAAAFVEPFDAPPPPPLKETDDMFKPGSIRAQLREWQALHANPEEDAKPALDFDSDPDVGDGVANHFTRLPDPSTSLRHSDQAYEEEQQAMANFRKDHDGMTMDTGSVADTRFMNVGDLVELDFAATEKESVIAVFARRLGHDCQCFTMHGRWINVPERQIQYSIPGWVDKSLVEPLLDHIPEPKTQQEYADLREQAVYEDLSVPRQVSAPLVSRMVQFHTESREIYRKHAGTLDDAHNILAHETDLRYGSLVSAATTLLQTPANKLPVTALFTVRSALNRAGFAFNIDRRSHRLTGYLQIRSKEQVKMVDYVRSWLREWQDDLAIRSALESAGNLNALRKHRTSKAAQYVYDFIEKAKKIVIKSRENRDPTMSGNVGPSKKRFPITPTSDSVRTTTDVQFTEQEAELVRFMETWACHNSFNSLPRLLSLPPMILQATGLYEEHPLGTFAGFMFLQELGTIMPYENRVRFDAHLLLPSSQHSKPLQNLMSSLLDMENNHNFTDSMRRLRHDWGSMSVYCVDDASAQEIDDGLSVEPAGKGQWWVHTHIANPTAFFERDHPLAKMARHMGETIYMPERTYMMLPRWATSRHFSLGKDRPCLTFSAKLDEEGRTLEKKICPGIVRNVLRLTGGEVRTLLGTKESDVREHVLTVGGEPPPPRPRKSMLPDVKGEMVEELKLLSRLAEKRTQLRRARGGVNFDMRENDVAVWQHSKTTGLSWDHPHRRGSRTVEGDPVIQMRTQGMQDWFSPFTSASDSMVREMMMLACETAAGWCAERGIPTVFRGTVPVPRPDLMDSEQYYREVMQPAAQRSPDGKVPMHMSLQYLHSLGRTALRTTPLPHKVVGIPHYAKVTSPLRRYGDMIVHWQIEAALREEARTGKSLVTQKPRRDYSFLPFSPTALETIMLGLQPREYLISKAKQYGTRFWVAMLMFRAHHFGEAELPWAATQEEAASTGKPLMRVFVPSDVVLSTDALNTIETVLNLQTNMYLPERFGLEPSMRGDTWEAEVDRVDVFRRVLLVKPVRLVDRTNM